MLHEDVTGHTVGHRPVSTCCRHLFPRTQSMLPETRIPSTNTQMSTFHAHLNVNTTFHSAMGDNQINTEHGHTMQGKSSLFQNSSSHSCFRVLVHHLFPVFYSEIFTFQDNSDNIKKCSVRISSAQFSATLLSVYPVIFEHSTCLRISPLCCGILLRRAYIVNFNGTYCRR